MLMSQPRIIDLNLENIPKYGLVCAKDPKQEGFQKKLSWLKEHFKKGLKIKLLETASGKATTYIEYLPGEYAWRPVKAKGYLVIHCLWNYFKKDRNKGYGSLLINQALEDAKKLKKHGVAVVTSEGAWMANKSIFEKNGFKVVDELSPFSLMVKKINPKAPDPSFNNNWEKKLKSYGSGWTLLYANQCPWNINSAKAMQAAAKKEGIKLKVNEIKNAKQAQESPTPYGVFALIHNGKLLSYHYLSKTRFLNILKKGY
jgi:hypothetical protein